MLRRLLPILALALIGCSKEQSAGAGAASEEPKTANLLVNGDCEAETIEGWTPASARGEGIVGWTEPAVEGKLARSGSRAIRLGPIDSRGGDSRQTLAQSVPVSSSRLWLDGWVRFEGSPRDAGGGVRAGIELQYCAEDEVIGDVFAELGPAGAEFPFGPGVLSLVISRETSPLWYRLPQHTTAALEARGLSLAKPPTRVVVTLWLQTQGAAEGKAWFDDLVVKEIK